MATKKITVGNPPSSQIAELAKFIMQEVEGEPSESEGAVDTAIRVMRKMQSTICHQMRRNHKFDPACCSACESALKLSGRTEGRKFSL